MSKGFLVVPLTLHYLKPSFSIMSFRSGLVEATLFQDVAV